MFNRTRNFLSRLVGRLSVHAGADKGRANADWKARQLSADAEIINDLPTLIARSRQLCRDESIAKSVIYAYVRNIVGRGIIPAWTIKNSLNQSWEVLNEFFEQLFLGWASDKTAVDVEGRRTFWQMERLAVSEKKITGDAIFVWSYVPHPRRVGLTLQAFEAEQLDHSIQSFGGNEVRGGIEINAFGRPVAYHLFLKPLVDLYGQAQWKSERITADRVLTSQNLDRVLQTRGRPVLAPVMQDIRTAAKFKIAELMAGVMQACIGVIFKRPAGSAKWRDAGKKPAAAATSGATSPEKFEPFDFAPGMMPQVPEGYEATPFTPTRPGGLFDPFWIGMQRIIAAGTNLSYGQVSRDFTKGTYSGQRQEMVEDYKVFDPEQDDLVDDIICPVVELFTRIAIMEGRAAHLGVTPAMYALNSEQFNDQEYTLPAKPWIDPKNEIEAWTSAIDNQLATRTEYAQANGKRYRRLVKQAADEKALRASVGVALPSDLAPVPPTITPPTIRAPIGESAALPAA